MTAGAASSGLVAVLFDGRSAFSMAAVMVICSLFALIAYYLLARPAERRIHSQTVEAPATIEGAVHP
jgi:MFS transporter, DHA1 family, multidrug resistance protein